METESFFAERKRRWISRIYYHLAASPNCNLHPFQSISDFLQAKVGDLVWGKDSNSRMSFKTKFSQNLTRLLDLYGVNINMQDVANSLTNDNMTNYDLVNKLAGQGR